MALEKSLNWPGLYFILGGRLSPMDDMGPTEIGFPELLVRIEEGLAENGLREIVVATSYTPEGDATAYYLMGAVKKRWPQLRITRLARGLPSAPRFWRRRRRLRIFSPMKSCLSESTLPAI